MRSAVVVAAIWAIALASCSAHAPDSTTSSPAAGAPAAQECRDARAFVAANATLLAAERTPAARWPAAEIATAKMGDLEAACATSPAMYSSDPAYVPTNPAVAESLGLSEGAYLAAARYAEKQKSRARACAMIAKASGVETRLSALEPATRSDVDWRPQIKDDRTRNKC